MYAYLEAIMWCCVDSNHQDDLEFVSRVLDDMPFAQLHLGSGMEKQQIITLILVMKAAMKIMAIIV